MYQTTSTKTPLTNVEFWLRTPAADTTDGFHYDKLYIGGQVSDYTQPMLNVPAVGDLVVLAETIGEEAGTFRVLARAWRPVLFGDRTNWAHGPVPTGGDALRLVVERAGGDTFDALFPDAVERSDTAASYAGMPDGPGEHQARSGA